MAQSQNVCVEDIEANINIYKNIANNVYEEYKKSNKQLFSKLNGSHLEPFAEVLMEHENIVLKGQDELMETIRHNLEEQMQHSLDNFWQSNNVSEALVSLEICKEKFQPYNGHNWNMDKKSPLDLTRPTRMRIKENRLRFLQAQLNSQDKNLEAVLQENASLRQLIQDVKNERTSLLKTMENFQTKFELAKAEITKLQLKMIRDNSEDDESNIDAEIDLI